VSLLIALVPMAGDEFSQVGAFPKYIGNGGIAGRWQALTYGKEPWALVAADVTPAERTFLVAQADAAVLPVNLDNNVGGALATVQAKLEAANIPADWVTSGMTWRFVFRVVVRIVLLMQRFAGAGAAVRLFVTIGLDSTVGDIPIATRQRLVAAAQTFGLDTSGIGLAMTIRAALRILGQQMTFDITIAGESL
jgi:hypothetical protein